MTQLAVTVIGLGKMGSVLAQKLLEAKFDVTVYNRTVDKMKPLIALGAKGSDSAALAVKDADIVLTSLLDDLALKEVVDGPNGFIGALKPSAIHISTSTILPETAKSLTKLHEDNRSIYLGATVLGVPKAAAMGKLTTIVAGDSTAIDRCKPIFECYAAKIMPVGNLPYQANAIKICINTLLVTTIEMLGELYTFAEKNQCNTDILQTFFHEVYSHPAFKLYVDKVKERNFDDVNFMLTGGLKDLRLFQQAFLNAGVAPEVANIILNKFVTASNQGLSNKDWSAVTEITRKQSGLN